MSSGSVERVHMTIDHPALLLRQVPVICFGGKMALGTGTERPPSAPATLVPGFPGSGRACSLNWHTTVLLPSGEDLRDTSALRFI